MNGGMKLYWENRQSGKKEIILPNYDVVENRVLIYEILGYLASYANYLLDIKEERANEVLNYIVGLINEYEYFVYAPYDVSVNVMIMIYKLLYHFKRKDEIGYLIEHQTETIKLYFELYKKFPAPSDTFEEAMEIEMNPENIPYEVSAFGVLFINFVLYGWTKMLWLFLRIFLEEK